MLRPKKKKKDDVKLSKDSWKKAKKIFSYLRPYSGQYFIGWIFLILSSSMGLIFPLLMGQLLGSGSDTPSSMQGILEKVSIDNVNSVALGLLILFVGQAVFSFIRVVTFTNVTEGALRDMRHDAFKRLIYMPMDFFNQNKVGELMSRISADITQVQEVLRTTIAEFFRQIIIIVGGVIILVYLSWKLSLIMFATVPVVAIIAVLFGRFIRKLSKKAQDETATSNSILEESLMGISNVKAFTNERFMLGKFEKAIDMIKALNVKSGLWRGVFVSFIIFCLFGAIVFIVWQGILMTQGPNPELAPQDFFSIIMFTIMMGASFGSIPDMYASIQKAIGATEHLMSIMEQENELELYKGTEKPAITGKVEFKDVIFHYPQRKDVEVLKGISLSIDKNETVALVGSSGAGKSTIASLILNYYPVSGGSINFDGVNADAIAIDHLREHIAIVPQEVILFAGSIRENIAYGKTDATDEEILKAADQANALEFINGFPEGLDTQVGDRGIQLSGGQKQRIAIARAILKNPTILILDEATSALDSESEKLVQDALNNLMKGRTSVVIAHRLSTIKEANKILVLGEGKVLEQGTHDELMSAAGNYAKLVELQNFE
ncbi:MAG: ABC transporter ATP-binding protein [Crocinitomicaceae bacterium]